jgi:hypothetical protein
MLRNIVRAITCFSTEVQKAGAKGGSSTTGLTYYKDGQLVNRTSITLKKQEDIESYVVKTVQNYFRTTYKQGTHQSIKESRSPVRFPSTAWTHSMQSKSPCRSSRI